MVVAAAGNSGYQRGNGAPGLADPAYDPYVIAVGASDSMGTPSLGDDAVASYSASAGNGSARYPDLVAPGSHLQGLRVPNSWLDANHPEGLLSDRYFRGSGTSRVRGDHLRRGRRSCSRSTRPSRPTCVKRFFRTSAVKLGGFERARPRAPARSSSARW